MARNQPTKTMRFWIFSGIAAIIASQLPLLVNKQNKQEPQLPAKTDNMTEEKKAFRFLLLAAVILIIAAILLGSVLWLLYVSR